MDLGGPYAEDNKSIRVNPRQSEFFFYYFRKLVRQILWCKLVDNSKFVKFT